uniref:Tetraspanin n=1 Tax=Biomphalaria glabrata TaxID=6526 RepID=A0A2C9LYL6_BIOGL
MAAKGLKAIFIIINILLLMFGATLIGLGAWVIVDQDGLVQLAKVGQEGTYENFSKPGILDVMSGIAVVEGSLTVLLTILGFCGLGKKSKCYLALYSGILIALILLQIALIALAGVLKDRVNQNLRKALKEVIKTEYEGFVESESKFSRSLDIAQVMFECCGVDSYLEFNSTAMKWTDRTSNQIPKTCCKLDKDAYLEEEKYIFVNRNCARLPTPDISNIGKACYNDIETWIINRIVVTLALTVAFTTFQILGTIFAFCLLHAFRKKSLV